MIQTNLAINKKRKMESSLQASLDRRIAKLATLGDGPESKRQRKREFVAIGKLKKQLAEAAANCDPASSLQQPPLKKQRNTKPETGSSALVGGGAADAGDGDDEVLPEKASRKQMKGIVKTVNHKLSLMSTRKQLSKALKVFNSLEKRGIQGDVHTFTNVINACVRCGDLPRARAVYDSMRQAGITPNIITVTTLLKGLCEAGDVRGARALLDSETARTKVVPNMRTVNTLLRGAVRRGSVADGAAVFEAAVASWDLHPDEPAVTALVGLLCRNLQVDHYEKRINMREFRETNIFVETQFVIGL